jgi:hypothetical protein
MEEKIDRDSGGDENRVDENWSVPKPEVIPPPTLWPAVLAFGITLVGLGVLTSFLISLVGSGIFVLALIRWVGEMIHEQNDE